MGIFRKMNRRYFARMWAVPLIIIVFVIYIFSKSIMLGDWEWPLVMMILFMAMMASRQWRMRRWAIQSLQCSEAEDCLEKMGAGRIRNKHLLVPNAAIVYALYGRQEQAERCIASVSWSGVSPYVQSGCSVARAIQAYLCGDHATGLEHADNARLLADHDWWVPGARAGRCNMQLIRQLGLALAGQAGEAEETELRKSLVDKPVILAMYAAWGLAAIARHKGDDRLFYDMRQFIKDHAPHAQGLLASVDALGGQPTDGMP